MPLEGLRAWIGEVERKLGMRTRVFLVLATIAIGGAGAAIYLAVDTREDAVSESDVRELQAKLEGQSDTGSVDATQLEAEVRALQAEVARLSEGGAPEGGKSGSSEGTSSGSEEGTSGGETGTSDGGTDTSSDEDNDASKAGGASKAELQELLEEGKKQNAEAEKND
jgi:hypothetical protein